MTKTILGLLWEQHNSWTVTRSSRSQLLKWKQDEKWTEQIAEPCCWSLLHASVHLSNPSHDGCFKSPNKTQYCFSLWVFYWLFSFLENKFFSLKLLPALDCQLNRLFAAFKWQDRLRVGMMPVWATFTGLARPEQITHAVNSIHILSADLPLTHIPRVITLFPTWIGLATKAAPIVCQEAKAGAVNEALVDDFNMELLLKSTNCVLFHLHFHCN